MKKLLLTNLLMLTALCLFAQDEISEENPKDCTSYISNPSFEEGFADWTQESLQAQTNSSFEMKAGNTYVEKWTSSGNSVGNASVKQTLQNLPNGLYKLTVAAMNYSQDNKTKKNTGAYIFAGKAKTTVQTPNDYSVTFSVIFNDVEIGFVASNATGNWIALDNFRLVQIGYVDAEAAVTELQEYINEAESLQSGTMSQTAAINLSSAIDAAKLITTESADSDIQSAGSNLKNAIATTKSSIAGFKTLDNLISTAEPLQESMMSGTTATQLQSTLDAAKLITTASADDDVTTASTNLRAAINAAKTSIAEYNALTKQITTTESVYDESKEGAATFKEEIDKAKALAQNAEATSAELSDEIKALKKAELAFHLANATPGTGSAPKVTNTNTFVLTGATQAMVRASMTGSNLLESGVCWSTEHNPTVLDERTTEYHSLNGNLYHIRGMKPATVYYVRAYAMNKTYTVAYGDEIKIVTHPKGTCSGSWDDGAPTEEANERCRRAIAETIEYFNEWTGIKGFHLSGHYGANTPTADCSYGGWMRIGPNAGNQAIGTVLHETGHGVGVGTSDRWWDTNVHDWVWFGREATEAYRFLENKQGNTEYKFVGDSQHGWGSPATYDWLVNGSDKDKHTEIQYAGGMCILHGLFIDGLCPTGSDPNGISGYTYNFDDSTKYYLMNKDKDGGLGLGVLYQRTSSAVAWQPNLTNEQLSDSAAWYMEFNPQLGYYMFKNAATGRYLTHSASGSSVTLKKITGLPSATERFQLMPDRTDVTIGKSRNKLTTHGYWFTWYDNGNKSMSAKDLTERLGYGAISQATFDYSDAATRQQWIIISEDELEKYQAIAVATGISTISVDDKTLDGSKTVVGIYTIGGTKLPATKKGVNIIRYSDGSVKKIYVE